jgi:transcriptional regulator with XRE-family HTH domain
MTHEITDSTTNGALYRLRVAAGLSQQDVADRVNELAVRDGRRDTAVSANTVSRWERGKVTPGPLYRRLLATLFKVQVDELGIPLQRDVRSPQRVPPDGYGQDDTVTVDPRVTHSQDAWRRTRRALNAQRPALTQLAAQLYDPSVRLGTTGLLARPDWLPDEPVDLAAIELSYEPNAPDPELDGTEPQTSNVRPLADLVRQYQRYTQAVRDLDPPRLFENRASWRLLDLAWENDKGRMAYGPTAYFCGVDTFEALAHEMAYLHLAEDGSVCPGRPVLRNLPFRRLVGNPFDFARRPILPSISTLTIRRGRTNGDDASFLLHRRDPRKVAVAGGMLQVIPSGVFQPSSVHPAAVEADFDIWRNIMREYSEELLGYPENDGDGHPIRYDEDPFQSLDLARQDGRVRIWCLGFALDALTLVGEILTVAVFNADLFDQLAGDFVDLNDEGSVITGRVSFTRAGIHDVLSGQRIAPAGAGCLQLAWKHCARVLSL